ncbi:alpha/beta fold hydrolase [Microbulbifer echini]|uniref:Alpha/beta fold hydrolase n=1 Tax=Microbulbifer echini TaxID=1529067 RepID=A0ABV4NQ81_9GAMM
MPTLTLKDGRHLRYDIYGDPTGFPVIFNHGFSDSRLIRNPDNTLTTALGVKMIAADQPGVGGSSPKRGRKMVDWGKDMEELANHLALDYFSLLGHSGGAPHALSVAYHLPDRVHKISLASPVAPLGKAGVAALLKNRDLKLIARLHRIPFLINWICKVASKSARNDINRFIQQTAREDPSDAATLLGDPSFTAMFKASFSTGMNQKGEGLYEMIMALWDWGFEPNAIQIPVEIFFGDADDILDYKMPLHLAKMLPLCTTHTWPKAGHYGFLNRDNWSELLSSVI